MSLSLIKSDEKSHSRGSILKENSIKANINLALVSVMELEIPSSLCSKVLLFKNYSRTRNIFSEE